MVEAVKQATLTGSEHRRALPFLPFAIIGVAGLPGDSEEHRDVARCICELVALTNSIFSTKHASGGITLSEATVLARKAHTWVVELFQPLLGPSHTAKLHRLSAHLLDEFRLRGNVFDGNSALNESLHKAVKASYKCTNKRRGQFIEQLIVNEQVHSLIIEDEADCSDSSDDSEGATKASAVAVGARTRRRHTRHRRRRYTRKQSVARIEENRMLPGLATALGCDSSTLLCPHSSLYFGGPYLRNGRQQYTIRASPCFHGSPWHDWVRYRAQDGTVRVGQAAVVLSNRRGTWQRLAVRRAENAAPVPHCVLSSYGCQRLRWDVTPAGDTALDVLKVEDILRWLVVEYDWEDLSERHGVTVMPDAVPSTVDELRATRFFVNAFACDGAVTCDEDDENEEDDD